MQTRQLGAGGPPVSAFGLGCMRMSNSTAAADEAEGIATIRAALDAGVALLDTGDFYGKGHNEELIRRALSAGGREKALLSVKFGVMTDPDGNFGGMDGRPQAAKNYLTYSLQRLGTDHVDIHRPGRLDPTVPIEDTIGAIAEMVQAGHVRAIGLSEVGSETIRQAHAVHPIADLQVEYSLFSRDIEGGVLGTCRELGIAVTAYGVPSYGLLSGNRTRQAPHRPTFGRSCRAFRTATWRAISNWSRHCARSPTPAGPPRHSWPLPGCSHRAASWVTSSPTRSWQRSRRRCRFPRLPETLECRA